MFVLNQNKLYLDLMSSSADFVHNTDKLTRAGIKVSLHSDTRSVFTQRVPSCKPCKAEIEPLEADPVSSGLVWQRFDV